MTTYCQGDLVIHRLSDDEAAKLSTAIVAKSPQRGSIRLLEGEVTGHHHEIVLDRTNDTTNHDEAAAIAVAAIAVAKARASIGKAALFADADLPRNLPWLLRADLMIGFLKVEGAPVNLKHPEHDTIKLPVGTYYVGRQVESAGAEERQVQD